MPTYTGLLYILFILYSQTSFSQTSNLDGALSELTDDIRQYEKSYKTLAVQRGMDYTEGEFTAKKLKRAISEYGEDQFGDPEKRFKFIFYHFRNDSMNIWLFSSDGSVDGFEKYPLKADSLMILENTLKFRVDIENRLAESRGGVYETTVKKYRLTKDEATEQLSRILLPEPIVRKMRGTRYLLILPCLNISSLPYGMLKPWNNTSTVIDSMAYSFVYNLREVFDTVKKREIGYQYTLQRPVIVGNPSFTDKCTDGLVNLEGAEQEAIEVAKLLGVTPYIGRAALKNEMVERMEVSTFIYLATHGYSDPEDVMDKSFVALYNPKGCGFLTPREIQQMAIPPTAIVVLSACETGNGRILDAGVIGLARGFLKANAKSVVMSLWKVNDEQTKELMLLFMDELKKPRLFFPAENFRQAVLRYKNKISNDPAYWASFQNFGTPLRFLGENSIRAEK